MPCIVNSEKSDPDVTQNDSQLGVNTGNLKMETQGKQENGVETPNGENGHVDVEEATKNVNNGSDLKSEDEAKQTADDGSKDEEKSDKAEGMMTIIICSPVSN